MIDLRHFRLKNINDPPYRHLKLLLFWVVYSVWFLLAERVIPMEYHLVGCPWDSRIPFCEWFLIPYVLWYGFVAGPVLYLAVADAAEFRRLMYYIMATYGTVMVIYALYPTCQNLRPEVLPRDNLLCSLVAFLYRIDTPTNVCPSLHVVGSVTSAVALCRIPALRRFRCLIWLTAVFISISTIFIKQHSLVDVTAALILCAVVYPLIYQKGENLN